jgi:hypothetical protein
MKPRHRRIGTDRSTPADLLCRAKPLRSMDMSSFRLPAHLFDGSRIEIGKKGFVRLSHLRQGNAGSRERLLVDAVGCSLNPHLGALEPQPSEFDICLRTASS